MGAQTSTDLLALLRECEAADSGLIVERRSGELGFDSHTARENLATSLTLDYASQHIDALAPTDDDLLTVNKWTVTRIGGVPKTVEQTTGPMGTDPITGAGRYENSASLNLYEDTQARHQAGWRVWLGTVNEYRYPTIVLKLHNSRLSALRDTIAAVDISDRVVIENPPSHLPPDDIDQIVEGYTEVINSFEWTIAFNCSPYSPYAVGEYDTSLYDTMGSELAADFDAGTDTSMSVTVTAGPLWTTTVASPFNIRCGGAVLTVTAISGATSPQTFTITQTPVNGLVKTIASGTSLSLDRPAIYAL